MLQMSVRQPRPTPADELIRIIRSGSDLSSVAVHQLADDVEAMPNRSAFDREIGNALFARSPRLFAGDGLPLYLARYTKLD
jgi:hypothetical protein